MAKMILCTDEANGLGNKNTIPWYSKDDFQHFKMSTIDSIIVMGFNTWKSLPKKPLPSRLNIVLVSRPYTERSDTEYGSNVLFLSQDKLTDIINNNPECIIIGGLWTYLQAKPFVTEIIKSTVKGTYDCDVFFDVKKECPDFYVAHSNVLNDGTLVEYYLKKES